MKTVFLAEQSFCPVLLPRLDRAYLFVVVVHVMVVEANDGGLSWGTQTRQLNMKYMSLGMWEAAVRILRMTETSLVLPRSHALAAGS